MGIIFKAYTKFMFLLQSMVLQLEFNTMYGLGEDNNGRGVLFFNSGWHILGLSIKNRNRNCDFGASENLNTIETLKETHVRSLVFSLKKT